MSDLAAALMIAIKVHAGQVDKQGEPYLLHVLRVVEVVSDEAKVVAALHDVVEDGPDRLEDYCGSVLSEKEWAALELLTRGFDETYADYIAAIGNERAGTWSEQGAVLLAREIKIADLRDNLSRIPSRPGPHASSAAGSWDKEWAPLKARYEKALAALVLEDES